MELAIFSGRQSAEAKMITTANVSWPRAKEDGGLHLFHLSNKESLLTRFLTITYGTLGIHSFMGERRLFRTFKE